MKPIRVQRKRIKGWRMPPNTISVTRGTEFGNPFKVGGWFMMGSGGDKMFSGFSYVQATEGYQDSRFTMIKDNKMAVEWFKRYIELHPYNSEKLTFLKGKNLACFCSLDQPCHADVLLKIANL